MKQQYPKWLYNTTGQSAIAKDIDDHAQKKADGWMTADEYDALASAMPTAPQGTPLSEEPASQDELSKLYVDDDLAQVPEPMPFGAFTAADAVAAVKGVNDEELLRQMRASEENRAGGPRKTVLKALADKLGASAAVAEPAAEQETVPQ